MKNHTNYDTNFSLPDFDLSQFRVDRGVEENHQQEELQPYSHNTEDDSQGHHETPLQHQLRKKEQEDDSEQRSWPQQDVEEEVEEEVDQPYSYWEAGKGYVQRLIPWWIWSSPKSELGEVNEPLPNESSTRQEEERDENKPLSLKLFTNEISLYINGDIDYRGLINKD